MSILGWEASTQILGSGSIPVQLIFLGPAPTSWDSWLRLQNNLDQKIGKKYCIVCMTCLNWNTNFRLLLHHLKILVPASAIKKLLWLLLHAPAPHPFGHLTSTKFLPEKCWNAAAQTYVLDYKTQPAKSLVKVCVLIPYKRCFPVTFVFVSLVSARKHIWFWNYVSETRSIVNAQSCEEKTYLRGVFFCDHHTITFNVVFNTFSLGGVAEYVRSSSLQSCFFRFST